MGLAVVKDLRVARAPVTCEELKAFETDALAGFVLARAAAGLSDATISSDVMHLEQVRAWFGRPLWDMEPADDDGGPAGGAIDAQQVRGRRAGRQRVKGV
ncbi:hypothetical protein [Planotetraspora sp. GP83]|uniref:hypothetical protein n=1 Tax=Planotetraspora sp. GP83 TaxID=3156264 RepID=UPI003516C91C